MKWILLDHAVFMAETGLLAFLARHFFSARRKGRRYTVSYIALLLISHKITVVIFAGQAELTAVFSGLADYLLLGILWPGQWYKRMFIICFYYVLMIIIDLLLIFVFPITAAHPNPEQYQLLCMIASRSLLLFIVILITGAGRQKKIMGNHFIFIAPLPAVIAVAILMSHCGYEVYEVAFNRNLNFTVIVILAVVLVLLCTYTRLARNEEILQERLKMQKKLRREQENYSAAVLKNYASIRRTRHDLHHYVDAMTAFVLTGQYEQAVNISRRARQGTGETLIFTGNETVDAIIYSKQQLFEQTGAVISIDGLLPAALDYDGADLCIVLSNALENAAEAVAGLPARQRTVYLKFRFAGWLLIVVENEIKTEPKTVNGRYISGKAGALHGIGLDSMAAACRRQNGYLETEIKDGKFILAATMQPEKISKKGNYAADI